MINRIYKNIVMHYQILLLIDLNFNFVYISFLFHFLKLAKWR